MREAIVTVRERDELLFMPDLSASADVDPEWAAFCKEREGQRCVVELIHDRYCPTPQVNDVSRMPEPAFTVRFSDGPQRRIDAHHLTVTDQVYA